MAQVGATCLPGRQRADRRERGFWRHPDEEGQTNRKLLHRGLFASKPSLFLLNSLLPPLKTGTALLRPLRFHLIPQRTIHASCSLAQCQGPLMREAFSFAPSAERARDYYYLAGNSVNLANKPLHLPALGE